MPLPITPTVFTVFTIASTRCSSRSPSAIFKAIFCLFVIPAWMPHDRGLPGRSPKRGSDPRLHVLISYPDLGNGGKRQPLMYKEFGLADFLPTRIFCRAKSAV